MEEAYIAGAAMSAFGVSAEPLDDLMAEAALGALRSAHVDRPDALVVSSMNPEEFVGEGNFASHVATALGLARVPALRVETATSSGAAAIFTAYATVAAGVHRSVLVVGGEKMTHLDTPRVSQLIGRSIDAYERSYGATMPALAGLVTRAWMTRTGATLRDISLVAVKNHENGARNPWAHFRTPVALDTVMESRVVADPLRLFHCCPISDGAAAVVVTSRPGPVRIAGIGQGSDYLPLRYRDSFTGFRATQEAARAAYRMAGFGPERVEVAEVHDAFTPFELLSMEDLGLAPPGKAARMLAHGETAIDGRLPVNPSGGLKARGHPLGATGVAQVVELYWQLTGQATGRQVLARIGLAHSIGGLATNNWVTLLEGA
ncbi:MAG: thiolase C-terminal domain-containing protein [Candidatus Rokuibacteriota bacterium]